MLYAGTSKSWLSSIEFCWLHKICTHIHCFSVDVHCVEWSTKCKGGWMWQVKLLRTNWRSLSMQNLLIVKLMKIGVIWDTASCWLVSNYERFGSNTFFWDISNYVTGNSETSQKALNLQVDQRLWTCKQTKWEKMAPPQIIYDGTLCSTKIKRPKIFLSPEPEVKWSTVTIIIRVVLLSPCLCIRGVSLPSIHYNQSRRVYINQRHQYICLISS